MLRGQKRKHVTLTLRTKVEILQKIDNGEKLTNLANFYGIARGTIHDIKKNREKILNYVSSERHSGRRTMKSGVYPQVENMLYKWFLKSRAQSNPITGNLIREKARFFYSEIMNKDDFKASEGWLDKFKKRFGIRRLGNTGPNLYPEVSYSSPSQEKFLQKVLESGLLPDQIYVASESILLWKLLPYKKYRSMSRDRIAFMHCSNSTATHKLKLVIVGDKEEGSLKNSTQHSVLYKTESQACISQELMSEWFHENFVPSVSEFLKGNNLSPKALLILNNFQNVPNETVMESHDGLIQIMFLHENYTLSSPMDESVSHAIKCNYKKDLMYKAAIQNGGVGNFVAEYKLKDAVLSLAFAWEKLIPNIITLPWKNLWPTHPLLENTSEIELQENDNFLMNKEFIERVFNICTKDEFLTKDDMIDWLSQTYDEDVSMVNDEELINSIKTEDTDVKDVPAGWSFDPIRIVNNDEAIHAINTCIRWGEDNDMEQNEMDTLNRIREKVYAKAFRVKTEQTECVNPLM